MSCVWYSFSILLVCFTSSPINMTYKSPDSHPFIKLTACFVCTLGHISLPSVVSLHTKLSPWTQYPLSFPLACILSRGIILTLFINHKHVELFSLITKHLYNCLDRCWVGYVCLYLFSMLNKLVSFSYCIVFCVLHGVGVFNNEQLFVVCLFMSFYFCRMLIFLIRTDDVDILAIW